MFRVFWALTIDVAKFDIHHVDHEIYLSSMYQRKGSTCSSLVKVVANNHTIYGRIIKFILLQSRPIALVKVMHPHTFNICKETSKPSQPFMRKLADDCQLANGYLPVEELDELTHCSRLYCNKKEVHFY